MTDRADRKGRGVRHPGPPAGIDQPETQPQPGGVLVHCNPQKGQGPTTQLVVVQAPFWQLVFVQALPSSQAVPFGTFVPTHVPLWQLSPVVHALLSLHAVPSVTGPSRMQLPLPLHWPLVQGLPSASHGEKPGS
jgi:hypothetical protein